MKYLLDTNTCVQFLRYGVSSKVGVRLAAMLPSDVRLCSVVLGELLFGALRSQNVAKSLAEVQSFFSGFQSLPFDDACAEEYAQIRTDLANKGTPIGGNDTIIAAIARYHGLTLVTHNTKEFSRVMNLSLDDWQI